MKLKPTERAIVRYERKHRFVYGEALIFNEAERTLRFVGSRSGVYQYCSWEYFDADKWATMDRWSDFCLPLRSNPQCRYIGDLRFDEGWPHGGWDVEESDQDLGIKLQLLIQDKNPSKSAFNELWGRCSECKYEIIPAKPGHFTVWEKLQEKLWQDELEQLQRQVQQDIGVLYSTADKFRAWSEALEERNKMALKQARSALKNVQKMSKRGNFRVPEFIKRAGQAAQLTTHITETTPT